MKKIILLLIILSLSLNVYSQTEEDAQKLKSFYRTSLLEGQSYDWLNYLSNQIGGRLSGSLNAERAVQWAKEELEALELDMVNKLRTPSKFSPRLIRMSC